MCVHPPQMLGALFFLALSGVAVSSLPGLEEVFFSPLDQTVKEGEEASFRCVSGESSPPAIILWMKDGTLVTTGKQSQGEYGGGRQKKMSGTLRLVNVSLEDGGAYVCQTVNPLLNITRRSRPAKLTVLVSPVVANSTGRVVRQLGESAILPCAAVGVTPIWYKWTTDQEAKKPVGNSGGKHVDEDGSLHLPSVQASDAGEYFCTAENRAGRQQRRTVLLVTGCSSSSHCDTTVKPSLKMSATSNPAQHSATQIQPPMLPPPPFRNFHLELSPSPEAQMDNDHSLTQTTESSPAVQLQSSLQKPSSVGKSPPPTPENPVVHGPDASVTERASEAEDERRRNTSQSPITSNNTRSTATPEPPSWLPVLEKHDVPIVVGVGVSLAFIFITVTFYSVMQKNQPAPTGRSAQRKLGVPMRHAERQAAGRPYENQAFEDDECTAVTEHNASLSDTRARPPVTVQMEPANEELHSVTVETYPEPIVDTKIDDVEEKEDEEKNSSPGSPHDLWSTEEEHAETAADDQSLPPPSSRPVSPDASLRSSLTLRGAEALSAPIHHSLSVWHGGAPVAISHHVSVGRASVAVDVHFYPAVDASTLDDKQENA
ncbi:neuroglian [Corythoichthys intestinalis]|uniref:neuroglian n=1 Tax=Corythoichthys intestinalis TaxID=161448 RepID=UPI0025A5EB7D|nr:neuroglian [Corythoichthys intestinalis]